MAMVARKNPTTGAIEFVDDGAVAPPASMFPPKPEQESTVTKPIVSQESRDALKQRDLATGAVLNAQEQAGGVDVEIAAQTAPITGERVSYLQQQQDDAEARRVAREAQKARHLAGREDEVKKEADAQVRGGNAKEDLLGDGWGAFLAALLTGIGTAAHLFQGGSGPSPAERVLDKRIATHKEKLTAEWDALKSTRELRDRDHDAYLQAQRDHEDEVSRSVQKQLAVYDARIEQVAAKMAPEKQAALTALSTATTTQLAAKEKAEDAKRFDARGEYTNRSPSARPGSNPEAKPITGDTAEIVDAANGAEALKARQLQLLEKHGDQIPLTGPDAEEFRANNVKIESYIQRDYGKSDADERKAGRQLNAPGDVEAAAARVLPLNSVPNYKRSLGVSVDGLRRSANNRLSMERKGTPALASTAAPADGAAPKAEAKPQPLGKAELAELRGATADQLEKLARHPNPAVREAVTDIRRGRTASTGSRPLDRR